VMAFLLTYHQHAAQKHPVEGRLKELIEQPSNVLGHMDARHWSERQAVLLCMQTSDTAIELYWKDDMLRSRHGSSQAPSAHIPVVEDFADLICITAPRSIPACATGCTRSILSSARLKAK